MKAYDKFKYREVDGVIDKKIKPIKVSGKKKKLDESYVKSINKDSSPFFYAENKSEEE